MGIFQRRRERKLWQKHVSPEVIEMLLRETKSVIKPPEVKHFQFVVILADDANPHEVPAIISTVTGMLIQHRATVLNLVSSLLVGLLGVPFPEGNSPEARQDLVDALLRENGGRIRIAHGHCDAPFGMFGGPERWTLSAVIPGFSEILKKLLETEFGSAIEVS
jgi:hypothetical protein